MATGVADVLRDARQAPRNHMGLPFVYGSVAAGTEGADSDVDLMVVGDVRVPELMGALRRAQETLGREVNPTVYSPEEFAEKVRTRRSFAGRVLEGPRILLIGEGQWQQRSA